MRLKCFPLRAAVVCGLVAILLCGCANLSAVREFAVISAGAAEYTQLTEAYVQWPLTQKRFQPDSEHEKLESLARKRESQEKTLLLRHALVEAYMRTLGRLAADEAVTYDQEIESLGREGKGAKFLEPKEEAAFTSVAKLILTAAADAWRQSRLKAFVRTSNPHIKTVVAGLKQAVDEGFLGDLQDEKEAVRKHYGRIILESADRAGIAALAEWREAKLESIARRQRAGEAYSLALQKISDGHQKLHDAIVVESVTSQEFLGQMRRYAKEIQDAYKAVTAL